MQVKSRRFGLVLALLLLGMLVMAMALVPGCGCESSQAPVIQESPDETGAAAAPPSTQAAGELLRNGFFPSRFEYWDMLDQKGSKVPGDNQVSLAEGPAGTNAVHMTRTSNPNDGGASGLTQKLSAIVRPGNTLILLADVKCDLQEGGALAGKNPQWYPEGAVQFRIYFKLPDGSDGDWYHGFYYGQVSGADMQHFTQVSQGQWFNYNSGDIMQQISAAYPGQAITLTEFRVYGFGWDFDGYASALSLMMR